MTCFPSPTGQLAELTKGEVDAIAEHEHVPELVAAERGNYLVHTEEGVPMLRRMIEDDIARARAAGDGERLARYARVLRQFIETHPDYVPNG